jgi:hypothetical protein
MSGFGVRAGALMAFQPTATTAGSPHGRLAETRIAVTVEARATKPLLLPTNRSEQLSNRPIGARRPALRKREREALPSSNVRERSICTSRSISLD